MNENVELQRKIAEYLQPKSAGPLLLYNWIDFPEINRKVAFQVSASYSPTAFGCHSGGLTGLCIQNVTNTLSPDGKKYFPGIQVIDTTKEKQLEYQLNSWGGIVANDVVTTELKKVDEYLKDKKFRFEDLGGWVFGVVVEKLKTVPIYVLSDVINYRSPARNGTDSEHNSKYFTLKYVGKTVDFARWLIANKIGVVIESPIIQNPNHRYWGNYSLNQMWIWIHPNHLERTLDCATIHNANAIPDRETWLKKVAADLGPEKARPEKLFDEQKFPEERRFRENRV